MKLPKTNAKTLILIGGVMILLGWVIPLLIVMGYLESTYPLNFVAYGLQMFGMIIAMLGFFSFVKTRRDAQKPRESLFVEPRHPDDHD